MCASRIETDRIVTNYKNRSAYMNSKDQYMNGKDHPIL